MGVVPPVVGVPTVGVVTPVAGVVTCTDVPAVPFCTWTEVGAGVTIVGTGVTGAGTVTVVCTTGELTTGDACVGTTGTGAGAGVGAGLLNTVGVGLTPVSGVGVGSGRGMGVTVIGVGVVGDGVGVTVTGAGVGTGVGAGVGVTVIGVGVGTGMAGAGEGGGVGVGVTTVGVELGGVETGVDVGGTDVGGTDVGGAADGVCGAEGCWETGVFGVVGVSGLGVGEFIGTGSGRGWKICGEAADGVGGGVAAVPRAVWLSWVVEPTKAEFCGGVVATGGRLGEIVCPATVNSNPEGVGVTGLYGLGAIAA